MTKTIPPLVKAAPQMLEALNEANQYLAELAKTGGQMPEGPTGRSEDEWCRVQQMVSNAIREATK